MTTKKQMKNELKKKALNNKDLVPGHLSEGHADYRIKQKDQKTKITIKETSGAANQLTDFVLVVKGGKKNIGESLDINQTKKLGRGYMAIGGHVFDSSESEPNNFVEVENLEGFAFMTKTESCRGGWKFPQLINDPLVYEGNPDREGDTDLTVTHTQVDIQQQQFTFNVGAGCVQVQVEIFEVSEKDSGSGENTEEPISLPDSPEEDNPGFSGNRKTLIIGAIIIIYMVVSR